ncbi:MAG: MG2 domain-containing protein, partial [Planctomycetaceae bacterium]
VDQSGKHYPNEYEVMLYSERGTYRPGETIHLTGIIRDNAGGIPPPFPLSLHMIRPDGRTAKTLTVTPGRSEQTGETQSSIEESLAANGIFHQTFEPSAAAWTGTWRFHVTLPGSDFVLGKARAFVEEFVPVRLEVSASPLETLVTGSAAPVINVESRYLFGQPAAGLAARVQTTYAAQRYRSGNHPAFTFGPLRLPGRKTSGEVQTRLDATGLARISLAPPPQSPWGRWQADSSVTVTEDGGRSVSTLTNCLVDRSLRHIGLRLTDGSANGNSAEVVATGSELTLDWVLRDARDQSVTAMPVTAELLRIEFDHIVRRVNGRIHREAIERSESVWKQTLQKSANTEVGQLSLSCPEPGTYRLMARDEDGSHTGLQFQAVSPGGRGLTSGKHRPEQIQIHLDRPDYRPGAMAQATITSPFPGTALVCLESNQVISSQVVMFTETSANVAIDIPRSLRGGAFVTATLLRSVNPNEEDWMPHRARGLVRLKTDHTAQRLPVAINARAVSDLQDSIPLTVTTAPGAVVHLWAVDEGILATSGFQLPDPLNHFFAMRRNDVVSSDVFSMLLSDHQRPASLHRIGGDAGIETLRRNPVPARQSRPRSEEHT